MLYGLRKEFGGEEKNQPIHITIQGPYAETIDKNEIESCERILEEDALLIQGAGIFENKGISSVFMKVSSGNLRKVWKKPDYPVKRYGFHPHITMYTGKNSTYAREINNFLRKENIALLSHDFRLVQYTSRQIELFSPDPAPIERCFLELTNKRIIKDGILQRAHNLSRKFE